MEEKKKEKKGELKPDTKERKGLQRTTFRTKHVPAWGGRDCSSRSLHQCFILSVPNLQPFKGKHSTRTLWGPLRTEKSKRN